MSGKVVLTRKQAEALEEAKKEFENDRIIKNHITGNGSEWLRQCRALNGMTIDKLIKAVYIGYEIIQTAEDEVFAYFKNQEKKRPAEQDLAEHAIRNVLNILKIEINGINGCRNS